MNAHWYSKPTWYSKPVFEAKTAAQTGIQSRISNIIDTSSSKSARTRINRKCGTNKVVVLISDSRVLVSLALALLVFNDDVCLRFFSGLSMPAKFFASFPLLFWSRFSLRSSLMNFSKCECTQAFLSWQLFSSLWSSDLTYIHNFDKNCTQKLVGSVAESSLVHCLVWRYAGIPVVWIDYSGRQLLFCFFNMQSRLQ